MKRAMAVAMVWSSFAFAAPQATIVPPEGWTETQVEDSILDGMARIPGAVRVDARVWREARTGSLYVLERDTRSERTTADNVNDAESVFMGTMGRAPISKSRKTVDNREIVDYVFVTDQGRAHLRGIYALDARGVLHSVSAQCLTVKEQSPACNAALETLALPGDAVPIPPSTQASSAAPDIVDKNSAAYRAGKIMGFLLVVGLLVYWFYSKKKPPSVPKVS